MQRITLVPLNTRRRRTVFNFSIEDPGHPNRQVSLLYLLLLWLPPPFSIFLDASGIVPFRYRIHAYDAFDDYASSGRHVVDEMRSNRVRVRSAASQKHHRSGIPLPLA